MKKKFSFTISYYADGKFYTTNRMSCEHFDINIAEKEEVLKVVMYPKTTISHVNISMDCIHLFTPQSKIFVNGYQSWTDSREFNINEKMPKISGPALLIPLLKAYGDENIVKYSSTHGIFHGFTYAYIREYNKLYLYGSMTEKNGFTIIKFNVKKNQVQLIKDLEGVSFNTPYEVFNFGYFEGEYNEVFDRYFSLQNLPSLKMKRAVGYTSWYNYYTKVTKKDIETDLKSFNDNDISLDFFQIDDGYQTAVGDWMSIKPDFGNMREISDKIHAQNINAGLWLAPFACLKTSTVFKTHPDWLLRDQKGKLVKGGLNWSTSGFYVLDFLKPGVQEYLREVFDTILNKWNFDMVKLDFLYATCICPRANKSRGQIMSEAMDFIRACVGNKLILGCGVPLGSAFGKVDFCRIGCDVGLKWSDSFIEKFLHRERVSTTNTLNNTIFRRALNGRAFVNDPDVFFLRDYNIKLNNEQKTIIADINKLFGGVLFISDNISTYNSKQINTLTDLFKEDELEIISAEYITKSVMSIEYTINGIEQKLCFDIQTGTIICD